MLFLVAGLAVMTASAQDFGYGAATKEELSMQHYDMDTSAHAVVLNEYGSANE